MNDDARLITPPANALNADESYGTTSPGSGKRLGENGLTYPIGFVSVAANSANGNAVGGMLVADNTGIPLEFVITTAVRPTAAQQILYGKRLKSYVAVNLCGKELLSSVKTKPAVIFVRDETLLTLHEFTEIPVLLIRRNEELGSAAGRPTVVPPKAHPKYAQMIDLTSLDADMLDAFDRIEKCREVLAKNKEEYRIA